MAFGGGYTMAKITLFALVLSVVGSISQAADLKVGNLYQVSAPDAHFTSGDHKVCLGGDWVQYNSKYGSCLLCFSRVHIDSVTADRVNFTVQDWGAGSTCESGAMVSALNEKLSWFIFTPLN